MTVFIPSDSAQHTAVTLSNSWTRVLSSTTCNYRVSVALPSGPAPAGGFPVMYLLDANAGFATVVETHRRLSRRPDATHVGQALIVGIGHETDSLYDTNLRHRDFTGPLAGSPHTGDNAKGNASAFLDFIEDQVKPLASQTCQVNPSQQILAGHSLAGFFTLWVLNHRPEAFQGYISLSPSLWWNPDLIESIAKMQWPNPAPGTFLAVGEWEEKLAPWQIGQEGSLEILARRQQRRMVSNVQKLGSVLTQKPGSEHTQCLVFPDEDHASIFTIGMSRAMRMML